MGKRLSAKGYLEIYDITYKPYKNFNLKLVWGDSGSCPGYSTFNSGPCYCAGKPEVLGLSAWVSATCMEELGEAPGFGHCNYLENEPEDGMLAGLAGNWSSWDSNW